MSHVADGDLHAYLDGALEFYPPRQARRIREHLERCSECRRRLDAESGLVGEARTVLAEATTPEVTAPPLEELRRRAELGQQLEKKPTRTAWRVHWAWAATVIVALGIGWGVGAWPGGSAPREGVRPEAASTAEEPAAASQESRSAETAVPPPDAAPAPVVAESETVQKSEAPPARVAAGQGAAEAPPSANAVPSVEASVDERRTLLADRSIERRAPELPAPPIGGDASTRLSQLAGASVTSSAARGSAPTTGSASAADVAGAGRRGEQSAQLERPMVSQSRTLPGTVGFSDPRIQAGGLQRGLDRQMRAPQEPAVQAPLTIPGLGVELVELGDVGPESAVHVAQRYANGTRVDLYFVGVDEPAEARARDAAASARMGPGASVGSAAPAPAAPPAPAPAEVPTPPEHVASFRPREFGWEQLIVPFRGGWLIIQAPLSRATMRGLLQSAGVPLP